MLSTDEENVIFLQVINYQAIDKGLMLRELF